LIVRRLRRNSRLLQRLWESREYLVRKKAKERVSRVFAVVVGGMSVLQNFCEMIKDPEI